MNAKNANRNVVYSDFYCQECNTQITLPRKKNRQREKNHIKDIYCIKCKTITKHDEVRFRDVLLYC